MLTTEIATKDTKTKTARTATTQPATEATEVTERNDNKSREFNLSVFSRLRQGFGVQAVPSVAQAVAVLAVAFFVPFVALLAVAVCGDKVTTKTGCAPVDVMRPASYRGLRERIGS